MEQLMPGTLNMWSAVQNFLAFPIDAPNYMDLSVGLAYAIVVANTTDDDIDSGTLTLEGADALPDNPCAPGPFEPLDPVAGCAPIVSGVPEEGPVTIDLSERPIHARGVCLFAAPCPRQFLQVTGAPAGVAIIGVITRLRRTDFGHQGPWGFIPRPLSIPFGGLAASAQTQVQQPGQPARRVAAPGQQAQAPGRGQQQPAPQPRGGRAPQPETQRPTRRESEPAE